MIVSDGDFSNIIQSFRQSLFLSVSLSHVLLGMFCAVECPRHVILHK